MPGDDTICDAETFCLNSLLYPIRQFTIVGSYRTISLAMPVPEVACPLRHAAPPYQSILRKTRVGPEATYVHDERLLPRYFQQPS